MDNLEEYIKRNAEAFNSAELLDGHLDRFIEKMDVQSQHRPNIRRIVWASIAVAAALAAIIFLNHSNGNDDLMISGQSHDWFANVGNDQVEICQAYYDKVSELYEVILSHNPDGSLDDSISSIAEEAVPLVDQLPEEMDPEARAAVLKEYYGELLDGLESMLNIK